MRRGCLFNFVVFIGLIALGVVGVKVYINRLPLYTEQFNVETRSIEGTEYAIHHLRYGDDLYESDFLLYQNERLNRGKLVGKTESQYVYDVKGYSAVLMVDGGLMMIPEVYRKMK